MNYVFFSNLALHFQGANWDLHFVESRFVNRVNFVVGGSFIMMATRATAVTASFKALRLSP